MYTHTAINTHTHTYSYRVESERKIEQEELGGQRKESIFSVRMAKSYSGQADVGEEKKEEEEKKRR